MGKSKESVPIDRMWAGELAPLSVQFEALRQEVELPNSVWPDFVAIVERARHRAAAFDHGFDIAEYRRKLALCRQYLQTGRTFAHFEKDAVDIRDKIRRRHVVVQINAMAAIVRDKFDHLLPLDAPLFVESIDRLELRLLRRNVLQRTYLTVWQQMVGEIYDWRTQVFPNASTRFLVSRIIEAATRQLPVDFRPTSLAEEALKKSIATAKKLDRRLWLP